jgi:hypothetical protein
LRCFNIDYDNPIVCSRRGTCVGFDECSCPLTYFGTRCEFTTCFGKNSTDPTVCSSHGTCIDYNSCSCLTGYGGPDCKPICFGKNQSDPSVCSGNGNCVSPNNCNCTSGYVTGGNCDTPVCFGLTSKPGVCSGKGNCTAPNNCVCDRGYDGTSCNQRIILWDLISDQCNQGCLLNKTFWEDCLLTKGASCYCNYISENVTIGCNSTTVVNITMKNVGLSGTIYDLRNYQELKYL